MTTNGVKSSASASDYTKSRSKCRKLSMKKPRNKWETFSTSKSLSEPSSAKKQKKKEKISISRSWNKLRKSLSLKGNKRKKCNLKSSSRKRCATLCWLNPNKNKLTMPKDTETKKSKELTAWPPRFWKNATLKRAKKWRTARPPCESSRRTWMKRGSDKLNLRRSRERTKSKSLRTWGLP